MGARVTRWLSYVGGATLALLFLCVCAALYAHHRKGHVPARTILEIDLDKKLVEVTARDPLGRALQRDALGLRDVTDALERGSHDARVAGVVARIGAAPMGMANIQELRDAVLAFRKSGKFAVAFSDTFGEFGPGNGSYYLATAFAEIYLQPSGDVGLTGLSATSPFVRGALDKLGVVPRMDHRYEYKTAMNLFTERKFTPAHKESLKKVLDSQYGQLVRGIAAGRKLDEAAVRALVDKGPYLGKEALAAHLVDGLGYRDEVYAKLKARAGAGAELLYAGKYLERAGRPHEHGARLALIYGLGAVERGEGGFDPLGGGAALGSATVAAAFRAAIADKDVRAIVFRVDSPGGSYVGSDEVWREVVHARAAAKPVIVSMGNVAGSGGYFVAMAADKIVAEPGTITGSIGVLGGKLLTGGLWDKVGLSFDELHDGNNARIFSGLYDYSPAEWQRFSAMLDRIYDDFTTKVAEGRKLPKARVLEIAKGRIWSGEDAKALGLVDELGGLATALGLARAAAHLGADADIELKVFPPEKSALAQLLAGEADSSDKKATEAAARALTLVAPLVRAVEALEQEPGATVLSMPPIEIR